MAVIVTATAIAAGAATAVIWKTVVITAH